MKISTTAWQQLLDSIATNAYASSHLDLSQLGLNSKNAMELAKALESNYSIKSLDVHDNKIGDAGFKELINNTTLTSLDISHNVIGQPDPKGIANNTALLKLGLEPTYTFELSSADSLAGNKSLSYLNLSYNALGGSQEEAIAQALSKTSLTTLSIGNNNLHDASIVILAQSTSFSHLDLSDSFIQSRGIEALASNTTLTSLSLANLRPVEGQNTMGSIHNLVPNFIHLLENTKLISLDLHSDKLFYTQSFNYAYPVYYMSWGNKKLDHYEDKYVEFKMGALEVLLYNQSFKNAFLNNTTLIDFNIVDEAWDKKHTTMENQTPCNNWGPNPQHPWWLTFQVDNHIADNIKSHAQDMLIENNFDMGNPESDNLLTILNASQDSIENTHLNTDLDNHHLETSDTVILTVPNVEINHDTLDDLTHDHAIPNEPISTAEIENSLATDTSIESFTTIDNMDVILQPNDLASLLETSNLFENILENTFDNTNEITPSTDISLVHFDNPIEVTPFVEQVTLTNLGLNTDIIPEYALS